MNFKHRNTHFEKALGKDLTDLKKRGETLLSHDERASDFNQKTQPEEEHLLIEALERYLRRASLAQAHPLPRWVMW